MKIITHKPDNTAYAKSVYNCEKFFSFCGIDFYCVEDKHYNTREYFCHLKGTADLLRPLGINENYTREEAQEAIKGAGRDRIEEFCTAAGELNRIKETINDGRWASVAEGYFCELMGEPSLAEKAEKNRARIREQREARELAERQARDEREARRKAENIERAEQSLKNGEWFTAEGFELLAEKYGIKLPIKFIGWLRQHCGEILIEKYTDEERKVFALKRKYNTSYSYNKGHKSTTIYDYADKLAEAVGI